MKEITLLITTLFILQRKRKTLLFHPHSLTPSMSYYQVNLIISEYSNLIINSKTVPNGSNAWVIHGNHTKSGKPLLANDPHLTNSIPATWT